MRVRCLGIYERYHMRICLRAYETNARRWGRAIGLAAQAPADGVPGHLRAVPHADLPAVRADRDAEQQQGRCH
eukprot:6115375-Pyramimonas_sp.AAC.2